MENLVLFLAEFGRLLLYIVAALGMATLSIRGSKYIVGFDLVKAIQKDDNRAAAYTLLGLLIMIGLVVGLFRL